MPPSESVVEGAAEGCCLEEKPRVISATRECTSVGHEAAWPGTEPLGPEVRTSTAGPRAN
eukprot:2916319-Pyramimonas_sp.AAC.1